MTAIHSAPTTDQIAVLAHKFWEDEGRPEGLAELHWLRATATLTVKPAQVPVAKVVATPRAKIDPKKAKKLLA